MYKYICIVLFVALFSCGERATIETEIVKTHTLHIEEINDTTHLLPFLKGIPCTSSYDGIVVNDNRLLKYHGIPVKSLSVEVDTNDKIRRVKVILFKDTETEDSESIKKILTGKFGEPEISQYDENVSIWKDGDSSYELKLAEKGYSNEPVLNISFVRGWYY